jgi:hypothetical protein
VFECLAASSSTVLLGLLQRPGVLNVRLLLMGGLHGAYFVNKCLHNWCQCSAAALQCQCRAAMAAGQQCSGASSKRVQLACDLCAVLSLGRKGLGPTKGGGWPPSVQP